MTEEREPVVYVVSDATAETAERVLRAALMQFGGIKPELRVFSMVRSREDLLEIMELAHERSALVLYTIVDTEAREFMTRSGKELGVPIVDLIGQLMSQLGAFLNLSPAGEPGVPRLTPDYFRRIEAVEFTIKHDDGQMTGDLDQADIVLVGISRTSKTPLSTYLAQKGKKVANVPVVLGLPLPRQLDEIEQSRIFGLTIDAASLIRIRRARLKALKMPPDTDYASREHVIRELEYARGIFKDRTEWPVIDVSRKAIEETSAIILGMIDERKRAQG
jgi:regulator of PEP synthase PpsR (kinase-PPPase family)